MTQKCLTFTFSSVEICWCWWQLQRLPSWLAEWRHTVEGYHRCRKGI